MRQQQTKRLLADSLIDLACSRPLSKVSVADVVASSGKNRKTFYYHFHDKNHLIAWVFRSDLGPLLAETVSADQLVYSHDDPACDPYPYYTLVKDGVRSLNGSAFVAAFARALDGRRAFYSQALQDVSGGGLPAYLRGLYVPALLGDIDFMLSNRFLDEGQRRFLAEYHFEALLGYLTVRLRTRKPEALLYEMGPFANVVHNSIADAITRQQQLRAIEHTS